MHLKARQPKSCAPDFPRSRGCYNPWAVCTAKVGRSKKSSKGKTTGKTGPKGRKVYVGPRGGRYVRVRGQKRYL